jgi:alpha-D-ribose 1-methylphosphonate 5-triphosphate synthase subunit PhnI
VDALDAVGQLVGARRLEEVAAATLTIPGGAVLGPTFDYWFTATQMRCVFGYDCQTATTTSPRGGVYTVPVTVG